MRGNAPLQRQRQWQWQSTFLLLYLNDCYQVARRALAVATLFVCCQQPQTYGRTPMSIKELVCAHCTTICSVIRADEEARSEREREDELKFRQCCYSRSQMPTPNISRPSVGPALYASTLVRHAVNK